MKKALPFTGIPIFLLRGLRYRHENPPAHCKVVNAREDVVAFKSNQTNQWYVKNWHWLLLSQHALNKFAQQKNEKQP